MLYLLADLTLLVEVVVDLQQLSSLFCFSCLVPLLSFCSIVLCFHYTRLCKLIVHTVFDVTIGQLSSEQVIYFYLAFFFSLSIFPLRN